MTRLEFLEQYNTISSFMDFIYDNDLYDYFEDIYSEESMGDLIDEGINESSNRWWEIRDALNDIEEGYEYYVYRGGYFDFIPLTENDVCDIQDRVLEAMADDFDPEELEEEAPKFEFTEIIYEDELVFEDEPDGEDSIGLFYADSGIIQVIE